MLRRYRGMGLLMAVPQTLPQFLPGDRRTRFCMTIIIASVILDHRQSRDCGPSLKIYPTRLSSVSVGVNLERRISTPLYPTVPLRGIPLTHSFPLAQATVVVNSQ